MFSSFFAMPKIIYASSEPSTYALDFDKNGDYVEIAHDSSLNFYPNNFSLAFWFKARADARTEIPTLVSKHDVEWTGYWYTAITSTGVFEGDCVNMVPALDTTPTTVDNNTWHFGVFTITNMSSYNEAELFYDTVSQGTANNTEINDSEGVLMIGGDSVDNDYWFDGLIDEVIIFNRTITSSEISYLYNSGNGRYEPSDTSGIVAWYKFDEGEGTVLYDRSGNDNDGTIVGATWTTGLTPDWHSLSPFFIQSNYVGTLSSSSYSNNILTFTVSGSSGATSTTKVYCGSKGEPLKVTGESSWTYDSENQICQILISHASSQEITLSWQLDQASGSYILDIYCKMGDEPLKGVQVIIKPLDSSQKKWLNQTTNFEGWTQFELPYGSYLVQAKYEKKVKTVRVWLSRSQEVGIQFENKKNPVMSEALTVGLLISVIVLAYLGFGRRK